MRDFWTSHNTSEFDVTLYSLGPPPVTEPGVHIKDKMGSKFVEIPLDTKPQEIASQIMSDSPDILVDLCGHAGTDLISTALSVFHYLSPPTPIVSYMGFPGSHGSPHTTHQIVDPVVAPPSLRDSYNGNLVFMPGSYFVNSHSPAPLPASPRSKRSKYNLPPAAFVYSNVGRSDKIDPATFSSWIRILARTENTCLFLLSSGRAMEANVRALLGREGLDDSRVIFGPILEPEEVRICVEN